jgi:hypothetical protein
MIKKFGISEAQAFRDIKNSTSLFGDVKISEREGFNHILFEYAMKAYNMARKEGNINQMNKAISNMIIIKGINKDIPNLPDFSMFQPHEFKIDIPKEVTDMLKKALSAGSIDVTKMMENNIEDIDHEPTD